MARFHRIVVFIGNYESEGAGAGLGRGTRVADCDGDQIHLRLLSVQCANGFQSRPTNGEAFADGCTCRRVDSVCKWWPVLFAVQILRA